MRVMSVSWNGNEDNTRIVFADEFICTNDTVQLDVLGDTIAILKREYSKISSMTFKEREEYFMNKVQTTYE